MLTPQHCTRDTHRKSPSTAWPLRDAQGRTWAERKRAARNSDTKDRSEEG